jgi:chemosensory pili system protein ChpA (sensor histidine kinase/response regulator)
MKPHGITLDKIIPISLDQLEAGAALLDEVDAEIFPFFEEEARAELKSIESLLSTWDATPAPLKDLERQYHTLKGAANSIGHIRIGSLAGGMKELMAHIDPTHTLILKAQLIKTNIQVIETVRALLQEIRAPKFNPVKKEQIVLAVGAIMRLYEMEGELQKTP